MNLHSLKKLIFPKKHQMNPRTRPVQRMSKRTGRCGPSVSAPDCDCAGMAVDQRGSLDWDSLYHTIKYGFNDPDLLLRAFTHRSYSGENAAKSNERLEFLGDAVLGLIVTDQLFRRFPEKDEGELTKAKSAIVSRNTLALWAGNIGLGKYIRLGRGEEQSGGRGRKSLLSNTFEAVIGAMFIDGGLAPVEKFLSDTVLTGAEKYFDFKYRKNFKSRLLEYVQAHGLHGPDYTVIADEGPDHDKRFIVAVSVDDERVGKGEGRSKKEAEQYAAEQALSYLGEL